MKPKLRGWLHAATSPLALAAGIVLIALAPTGPAIPEEWTCAPVAASRILALPLKGAAAMRAPSGLTAIA